MFKTVVTPEMHYDDWAPAYDGDVQGWDYHAPDRLLQRASDFLMQHEDGPRLLDVGIGTGLFSEKCRGVRPGLYVTGVDISARMLEICARKKVADDLRRVDVSADPLPFADGSFDVVAASGVMENIDNADHAIREMARVTRPGGLVLFTYPPTADDAGGIREARPMPLRTGRGSDGKLVVGRLTLFRHSAAHVARVAAESGLLPGRGERFVGYRTFVVVTVLYDLFSGRKRTGLQ